MQVSVSGMLPIFFFLTKQDITLYVKRNNIRAVEECLRIDPSCVNTADKDNVTLLHWACLDDWFPIVRLLVENGANIDAETIEEGHVSFHH